MLLVGLVSGASEDTDVWPGGHLGADTVSIANDPATEAYVRVPIAEGVRPVVGRAVSTAAIALAVGLWCSVHTCCNLQCGDGGEGHAARATRRQCAVYAVAEPGPGGDDDVAALGALCLRIWEAVGNVYRLGRGAAASGG